MKQNLTSDMGVKASVAAHPGSRIPFALKSIYHFECFAKDGTLRWQTAVENIVVNTGLDDVLDKYFLGSAYTSAHFVGLKATGTASAADTMSDHASWTEITAYSEANRQGFTPGAVSGQSVDNSASKATFTMTTATSVAGAFLTTDNTKGGSAGTLYGAADFSAARSVQQDDTLNVTVTCTAATG